MPRILAGDGKQRPAMRGGQTPRVSGVASELRTKSSTAAQPSNSACPHPRAFEPSWIDSDLEFPIKLLAADGTTIALEHIQIEAQPASLFELPSGFRKLDPRALIERIKHSDAWVDSLKLRAISSKLNPRSLSTRMRFSDQLLDGRSSGIPNPSQKVSAGRSRHKAVATVRNSREARKLANLKHALLQP